MYGSLYQSMKNQGPPERPQAVGSPPGHGGYVGGGAYYANQQEEGPVDYRVPRFSERAKFLPILFIVFTIAMIYSIYVFSHCIPALQLNEPAERVDGSRVSRGVTQLILVHIFTLLLVISYVRSILASPGEIPSDDPEWTYSDGGANKTKAVLHEAKGDGQSRRHCKWCQKYKPDRCHHCRICQNCTLRMDHHCPWIYNCVGFGNYKYFYLLLFYSVVLLNMICWTMLESLFRSFDAEEPLAKMFWVLYGVSLTFCLGFVITVFFLFHTWLMCKAMTTIEFCEKKMPQKNQGRSVWTSICDQEGSSITDVTSLYDRGLYNNVAAVLGPNPFLWLLPVSPPEGPGLYYLTSEQMEPGYEPGNRRTTKSV